MRNPVHPSQLGHLAWGAGILMAVALAVPSAGVAAGTAAPGPAPLVTLGEATAEIRFPTPTRHAVLRQDPGQLRRLVAPGDVLFHPQDPARSLTVERVTTGAMVLREGLKGRQQPVPVGKPLPGFPGLRFTGTVFLEEVHYRYRAVDHVPRQDPVLVSLKGYQALLEVEVRRAPAPVMEGPGPVAAPPSPPPTQPARAKLEAGFLGQVRVREAGSGVYEVNAADARTVLENTGRVLADLSPMVLPFLSAQTGWQYRISSAVSDGIISRSGYTVTAPKLAQRAGIQTGDTILRVNGRPVDGLASLYAIYRALRQDPALTTVQVELERRGTRLTQTYRMR